MPTTIKSEISWRRLQRGTLFMKEAFERWEDISRDPQTLAECYSRVYENPR